MLIYVITYLKHKHWLKNKAHATCVNLQLVLLGSMNAKTAICNNFIIIKNVCVPIVDSFIIFWGIEVTQIYKFIKIQIKKLMSFIGAWGQDPVMSPP